ncbi:hypothetical protein FRC06_005020 [Ceratobasidium sp. 370]|nr:hypothetical protein FRC06_005020 [Ceratobasidium sp. 370]
MIGLHDPIAMYETMVDFEVNLSHKPTDNLFCAAMVDRLFDGHPDWHPGKPKRVEWNKRKQAWDQEVAMANTRSHRSTRARSRARTRAPAAPQSRRPLFNPEPDSDDRDDGYINSDEDDDENFREEFLHELALQNRFHFHVYN